MDETQKILKNSLDDFRTILEKKELENRAKNNQTKEIIQRKNSLLLPIKYLLDKLVKADLRVKHRDSFMPAVQDLEDQVFKVYEGKSSPSWYPGYSLFIQHPAQIEIAVPNSKTEGVIVIKFSSEHPDAYRFDKKFNDVDKACQALAQFLASNVTSVGRKEVLKDISF